MVDFRVLDLRGTALAPGELAGVLPRAAVSEQSSEAAVQAIIDDVRTRGFDSPRDLADRFDGVRRGNPRVPAAVIEDAVAGLDPAVRGALEEAIARARAFASARLPADVEVEVAP
ncbi:histidinol dehydrogenase, partial [Arthrobacter sp. RIT-PI-e]